MATFDAAHSKRDIQQALATEIGRHVREANRRCQDADNASERAGESFYKWLSSLVYDTAFEREVASQAQAQFNAELFLDRLEDYIIEIKGT